MQKKWASVILASSLGAIAGASPFLGWVYLSDRNNVNEISGMTRKVSELVSNYNSMTWKNGTYRPKRIILLRHGQAHGYPNSCDCQVAGIDVCAEKPEIARPLTEEGKKQALQAGQTVRQIVGLESVVFYCSPFASCKQTFSYVSGSFEDPNSCMFVEDPRLRNLDFGGLKDRETIAESEDFIAERERFGHFYHKWPNGENVANVFDRVSSFLETFYRKWRAHDRAENFVLITHNTVMLTFLMRWFHWDVDTFNRLGDYEDGELAIMEKQSDGSYKLVTPLPCEPPVPEGVKLLAENPGGAIRRVISTA